MRGPRACVEVSELRPPNVRPVLLAYVDESHTSAFYWMTALVLDGPSVAAITDRLDEVIKKAVAAGQGVTPTTELHGYDIFHGKREWAEVPMRLRASVYLDAMRAIAETDAFIIVRGVDRARLRNRYANPFDPHAVVLGHLLERLDEAAEKLQDVALVIADEVDDPKQHREALWGFQRGATQGYRSRQLSRIIDTIHFAPSVSSRAVQAADLIAFIHRRVRADDEHDERSRELNNRLWETVAGLVSHEHCWAP